MNAQRSAVEAPTIGNAVAAVDVMTTAEAREAFDCAAQYFLNVTGDEFLRRWESGEFREDEAADQPGIIDLIMLLPLVR
jgi:hypothetical protein